MLSRTSVSSDAEETLISKIKIEIGMQSVSKYVQMKTDIHTSDSLVEEFRQQQHHGVIKGVALTAKVLTTGLWECEQNASCKLPAELKACSETFEKFYKSRHTGKNISWTAGLGDCEIVSHGYAKPYTFIVTPYQAAIIMLFTTKDVYTGQEISDFTSLPFDIMNIQMFNLMHPKLGRLLIKANAKVTKVAHDENIRINNEFASSSLRIVLVPFPPKVVIAE